jgi:hypothetical protein
MEMGVLARPSWKCVDDGAGVDLTKKLAGYLERALKREEDVKKYMISHARTRWPDAQWEVEKIISHCEGALGRDPNHNLVSSSNPCKRKHLRVYYVSWQGEKGDPTWLDREQLLRWASRASHVAKLATYCDKMGLSYEDEDDAKYALGWSDNEEEDSEEVSEEGSEESSEEGNEEENEGNEEEGSEEEEVEGSEEEGSEEEDKEEAEEEDEDEEDEEDSEESVEVGHKRRR